MNRRPKYRYLLLLLLCSFLLVTKTNRVAAQESVNDTIVSFAVVYNGDTIEAKTLPSAYHYSRESRASAAARAEWTRLRNAIYVTYPYAKKAGAVMNDINRQLVNITDKAKRKQIIKNREKELKKEFADPLTNLSVYQGKVLMKLINRETGNNCYEIIKEYKGGVVARLYQTVAFFFGSNLKQPYDKNGDEKEMEKIVLEVGRMYGFKS